MDDAVAVPQYDLMLGWVSYSCERGECGRCTAGVDAPRHPEELGIARRCVHACHLGEVDPGQPTHGPGPSSGRATSPGDLPRT